jgi:hypothetical protein
MLKHRNRFGWIAIGLDGVGTHHRILIFGRGPTTLTRQQGKKS